MPKTPKSTRWLHKTKTQISVLYAVGSLLILLVFSFIIYQSISNEYVQNAVLDAEKDLEQSSSGISLYIENVKTLSALLAQNEDVETFLTNPQAQSSQHILEQMDIVLSSDPYIQSIFLVSRDGRILSSSSVNESEVAEENFSDAWYQNAIENEMPVLTGADMRNFTMDDETWVISLSREIHDSTGQNIGVLVMDLRYSFIAELVEQETLGESGYLYILDNQKNLVYHADVSYFTDLEKQQELLEMSEMPLGYHPQLNQLSYQVPIEGTDWILLFVVSLEQLETLRSQLLELVIFTGLLVLSGSLLVGLYFASRISRPVQRLAKQMQHVEQFHYFDAGKGCSEEIRQLGQNYNEMLDRIQSLMQQLSQNEKSLKEFEIRALIGQINPHFLYNTLDTIVWMAEFEENSKVIEMTKSLAAFFRISLSGGQDQIPLFREVEHVRQYLFLQKQRYGEKLKYEVLLDEEIKDVLVPKIILQPLAENSIYHGIKPLDRPGKVCIVCKAQDENILITVKDDGVGVDKLSPKKPDHMRLSGIGLENVRARLQLFFGKQADLQIKSVKDEGTCVSLILPRAAQEDEPFT